MNLFLLCLRTVLDTTYLLALISIMTSFSCKRSMSVLTGVMIGAVSISFNFFYIFTAGEENLFRFFPLILGSLALPALFILTEDKPFQIFFHFFTAMNMMYMCIVICHIIGSTKHLLTEVLARALIYVTLLFFFYRYLAKPYQLLARNMKRDWPMIAAIPFLFFVLVMMLGLYSPFRFDSLFLIFIVYMILCCVYYMIYRVFSNTYELMNQRETGRLLSLQLSMQKEQLDIVEKNTEKIRLLRHDMRHFMENIGYCLEDGRTEDALAFFQNYKELFHQTKVSRYCENPVINSLISRYMERAVQEGIQAETKLDIPKNLCVDSMELAIVLSNALENSFHALSLVPEGEKKHLLIRCLNDVSFGLEIANTCYEPVEFDKKGYPISRISGHGYGIRSTIAFADKYDAVLDYEFKNNTFRMMMLIQAIS